MPLPNTRLIHPAFQRHHAPVAEGAMTAECRITRPATEPGQPVFDEAAGRSVYPDPPVVYIGPCRIQRTAAIAVRPEMVADRLVTARDYVISVPVSAPEAQANDLVTVTACPDDPTIVGEQLVVRDPRLGSTVWQRDMLCDAHPTTTR